MVLIGPHRRQRSWRGSETPGGCFRGTSACRLLSRLTEPPSLTDPLQRGCPGDVTQLPSPSSFCRAMCCSATSVPKVLPKEHGQRVLPWAPRCCPRPRPGLSSTEEGRGARPRTGTLSNIFYHSSDSAALRQFLFSFFFNLNIANQLLQALTYVL